MKRNRWAGLIGAFILLVFTSGIPATQPQWKGTTTKENGATVVKNPKAPVYQDPILVLKEELTLGGPSASGDYAFTSLRAAAIGDDGTIFAMDDREGQIKIFDRGGKYIKTFGRKGQGPGELNLPSSISINRGKGEIMIQEVSRRLSYFGLDGSFLRNQSMKETWGLRARVDSKGNIVIQEAIMDPKDPRYVTKKFDPELKLLAELAKSPAPTPQVFNPLMAVSYWTIDDQDNIVYGYPKTYEIDIFGPSHSIVKRILKDYDPVEISEAEKEAQRKSIAADGVSLKLAFDKYYPAFRRFFLSDRGHIFVQTWEKTKDGKFIHDIFDSEGHFLARMPLAPFGIEIKKGKYYALEEDADGYQSLKRYSVEWKIK